MAWWWELRVTYECSFLLREPSYFQPTLQLAGVHSQVVEMEAPTQPPMSPSTLHTCSCDATQM